MLMVSQLQPQIGTIWMCLDVHRVPDRCVPVI